MNLTQMKNTVLAVLAAAGSAIAQALGGWDVALKVLICFMALDYVTGWLVAAVWHKSAKSKTGALDSKASYKGLVKKGVMLPHNKKLMLTRLGKNLFLKLHNIVIVCTGQSLVRRDNNRSNLTFLCRNVFPLVEITMM